METAERQYSVYELVGGGETFQRLAEAFYRRVGTDPLLRPMYPKNTWDGPHRTKDTGGATSPKGLCSAIDRLAAFLAQFFGGPQAYSDARGHPRLKMRHVRFHIGQAERDAWLTHMCAAIDEIGIEEPIRSLMRQYFDRTSTFLINQAEPPA
jgi:hemoglobin